MNYARPRLEIRSHFKECLNNDDAITNKFAEWAFGIGYEDKNALELRTSWNEIHGGEYYLQGSETISSCAKIMTDSFKDSHPHLFKLKI